jgi:hypothetical protein
MFMVVLPTTPIEPWAITNVWERLVNERENPLGAFNGMPGMLELSERVSGGFETVRLAVFPFPLKVSVNEPLR